MSKKRRALAVAAATAGMTGMWAPAAFAGTGGGDAGGLASISHNRVPVQACGNFIPVNGVGGQVPLTGIADSLGLLSSSGVITSREDRSCHQPSAQHNDPAATTARHQTRREGRDGSWHRGRPGVPAAPGSPPGR